MAKMISATIFGELAGGELKNYSGKGAEEVFFADINTLEDAKENEITFLSNAKYSKNLFSTKAKCIIVSQDIFN